MRKAFICTHLLTATNLLSIATGQYTLPNGQVCPAADGVFVPVPISGTNVDVGSITTIQTVAMVCDDTRPLQVALFNAPTQITSSIVSVESGAPFAILSSPPGLLIASISPLGVLEFMLGRGMTTEDTRKAGFIIEVPQDQPLTAIEIGGIDDSVQIMGDFPSLSSIAGAGSGTQIQADFTGAPVVDIAVAGVATSTKIRTTSDITLSVAGSGLNVEIAGSVSRLTIAGGANNVLVEGTLSPNVSIAGMFNSLRLNDASGLGCRSAQIAGIGNTCSDSTDMVILEEIPCTSTAENAVCEVSKTANYEGCWCTLSPEGVDPTTGDSPSTSTTEEDKQSPAVIAASSENSLNAAAMEQQEESTEFRGGGASGAACYSLGLYYYYCQLLVVLFILI